VRRISGRFAGLSEVDERLGSGAVERDEVDDARQ
jgi:hypothetical protein